MSLATKQLGKVLAMTLHQQIVFRCRITGLVAQKCFTRTGLLTGWLDDRIVILFI